MELFRGACVSLQNDSLRSQVRAFLREHMPKLWPQLRPRSWMEFDAEFSQALAARGWVGLTLPSEYGGAGLDAHARFVLAEELLAVGAPLSAHWVADRQSGPQILKYGSTSQKNFLLPRICRAEAFFCIGMSEPGAGSDLAGVRSRATRAGEGWVLSGQKVWTTNAPRSHYMIALVRTSGVSEDRHKGLSQFIVDLSLPGIVIRPILDLNGDSHFSEVFFDGVTLSADALLGPEGAGWNQVVAELAFERAGPERIYSSFFLSEEWLAWIRQRGHPSDAELALAGKIVVDLCTLRAMSMAVTDLIVRGENPAIEASLVKDLGTEFEQMIPERIAALVGAHPDQTPPLELTRNLAHTMQISPSFSLRGGTREILRGMIARDMGLR